MKKTLLVLGITCSVLQVQAQTANGLFKKTKGNTNPTLQQLLNHQVRSNNLQKPTAIKQRVIAQSLSSNIIPEFDSTAFKYSGTRGSSFDFNNQDYTYSTEFTENYEPQFLFPGSTRIASAWADSIIVMASPSEIESARRAYYRSDNKIDSTVAKNNDGSSNFSTSKSINVFNSQGYLDKVFKLEEMTPGNLDTFLIRHISYNGAFTRVETDSTWLSTISPASLASVNIYHYSTGDVLDSIVFWEMQGATLDRGYSMHMSYYNDGNIKTFENYIYPVGAPVLSYVDSFGYTAGADFHTFYQEHSYDNGSFESGFMEIKHLGANSLPDSISIFETDDLANPWEHMGTLFAEYTSFDNPAKFHAVIPLLGTDTAATFIFYYEEYDDNPVSIKNISNKDFRIYPNPFTNSVSIEWKGATTNEPTTIKLVNILGQEVYKSTIKLNTGKNEIQIPSLNSGNYILIIQTTDGKIWSDKVIKK